jgi:hypothetical protein
VACSERVTRGDEQNSDTQRRRNVGNVGDLKDVIESEQVPEMSSQEIISVEKRVPVDKFGKAEGEKANVFKSLKGQLTITRGVGLEEAIEYRDEGCSGKADKEWVQSHPNAIVQGLIENQRGRYGKKVIAGKGTKPAPFDNVAESLHPQGILAPCGVEVNADVNCGATASESSRSIAGQTRRLPIRGRRQAYRFGGWRSD